MGISALILYLLSLDGCEAAPVAARLAGARWTARHVKATARRESRCKPVTVHQGDVWAAERMARKARKVGWLTECQSGYMGVRGSHGLSAAYSLRFLPPCTDPEALDVPVVSAYAAARRMHAACKRDRTRGCVRAVWAGRRNYRERPR